MSAKIELWVGLFSVCGIIVNIEAIILNLFLYLEILD